MKKKEELLQNFIDNHLNEIIWFNIPDIFIKDFRISKPKYVLIHESNINKLKKTLKENSLFINKFYYLSNSKGLKYGNISLADGYMLLNISDKKMKKEIFIDFNKKKEINIKYNKNTDKFLTLVRLTSDNAKDFPLVFEINGEINKKRTKDIINSFNTFYNENIDLFKFNKNKKYRTINEKNLKIFLNYYLNNKGNIKKEKKFYKRLITIDASTKITALSFFNKGKYIETKNIDLSDLDMETRFDEMSTAIYHYLMNIKPDIIIMEEMVVNRNLDTNRFLIRLQGVVCTYSIMNKCKIEFIRPTVWRKNSELNDYAKDKFENKKLKRENFKEAAINLVKEKYNLDLKEDDAESFLIGISILNK